MSVTETKPWYDTREGLEASLGNGLAGLQRLAKERHEAGYDRRERLGWWCVVSYFVFDECGNTMIITEGRPAYDDWGKYPPGVFNEAEWEASGSKRRMNMTCGSVPPTDEVCPRCLDGWDLRNAPNYKAVHDRSTETWTHYHKDCYDLMVLQDEVRFFTEILEDSRIKYTEMRLLPAEYPDRPSAPWCMVVTEKGPIKIGYRRRVISISWEHSDLDVDGKELFKDEAVTTGKTLVHAWGKDDAIKYLRKLMEGE